MDINKCKCCGELPFAEPVQKWFLITCCDQEDFHESKEHTIYKWNLKNKVTPEFSEKRHHAAIELAHQTSAVNVSADFNEMFSRA